MISLLNNMISISSVISLPFVLYIAFQTGKIIQNIDNHSKRIDDLEKTVYHNSRGD